MNNITPLNPTIASALKNLLPTEVPVYSNDDLQYLAGVTAADLMSAAFPPEGEVIAHKEARGYSDSRRIWGPAFAWSKSVPGGFFVLARRTPHGDETMLLKLSREEVEPLRPSLKNGYRTEFFRLVRELPPSCWVSYHPTVDQGLIALDKAHSDGPAVEKTLEALVLHCQILRNSSETVAGLAQKLLDLRPVDGAVKLAAVTDPSNLARATEEARHALDVRSPKPLLRKPDVAD